MDRRAFLAGTGTVLLATPFAAEAQQAGKVPVVGTLDYGAPDTARLAWWKALREALQELGYMEGRSIAFEARWAEGRVDRLPGLAAELARRQVNVIVTGGGEAARAAKQPTATIPIVMASGADPVQLGLVASLSVRDTEAGARILNIEIYPVDGRDPKEPVVYGHAGNRPTGRSRPLDPATSGPPDHVRA